MEHLDLAALEAGVDEIRRSPREEGRVELIVRRPAQGERERLAEATLDTADGLVGDNWKTRGSSRRPDGSPNPKAQLTIKNARMAALVAQAPERWELAGDQLYVDFDLSTENIPPGTRLEIGSAVVEVTDEPHTGCRKYHDRFGNDALRLVSSETGRALNLRGINTRVVVAGVVRTGDRVSKASS